LHRGLASLHRLESQSGSCFLSWLNERVILKDGYGKGAALNDSRVKAAPGSWRHRP
jgi:hypothetical protein